MLTPVLPRRLTRDEASMGRGSEASAFRDAVVVPENENLGGTDTEKNSLVAKEDCVYMEINQKKLKRPTTTSRFSLVNTNGAGAVAIFMVIPARTFLFIFALVWTLFLFCMIRDFPSHIRIL